MVKIVYPNTTVCYESSPMFTCTFEEATDSASWNMIQVNQLTALSNGNVVQLNNSCTNAKYKSCTVLTLQKVTSAWAGKYRDVARMIFCLNKKREKEKLFIICHILHVMIRHVNQLWQFLQIFGCCAKILVHLNNDALLCVIVSIL